MDQVLIIVSSQQGGMRRGTNFQKIHSGVSATYSHVDPGKRAIAATWSIARVVFMSQIEPGGNGVKRNAVHRRVHRDY